MQRLGLDFTKVQRTRPHTFLAPLRWKEPRMVFTCSMSDFFHVAADPWRDEVWDIIRRTPQHTYQILTKRPERIEANLPKTCFTCGSPGKHFEPFIGNCENPQWWPWKNVWLGTSVENQEWAEKRIPILTAIPAAVHFLSCEPLLGPIDFHELGTWSDGPGSTWWKQGYRLLNGIEWVIVGGESGQVRRPMNLDWARAIRDQCKAANVPFFFKQIGGRTAKENGRLLDGRTWDEMPTVKSPLRTGVQTYLTS